jgi:hypothetical protein
MNAHSRFGTCVYSVPSMIFSSCCICSVSFMLFSSFREPKHHAKIQTRKIIDPYPRRIHGMDAYIYIQGSQDTPKKGVFSTKAPSMNIFEIKIRTQSACATNAVNSRKHADSGRAKSRSKSKHILEAALYAWKNGGVSGRDVRGVSGTLPRIKLILISEHPWIDHL